MSVPLDHTNYPDIKTPDSQKGKKDYILKYAKAMMAEYSSGPFRSYRGQILKNRRYAKGKQRIAPYRKRLNADSEVIYMNLDWTPIKILPKFGESTLGRLTDYRHSIIARSIDPLGRDARIAEEYKLKAFSVLQNSPLKQSQLFQRMTSGLPSTSDEIDAYMSEDYKQGIEIAMEEGIDMLMTQNDFEEIEMSVKKNLWESAIGGIKTFVDNTGMIRFRSVDPANLVIPSASERDFTDGRNIGEVVWYSIAELKAMGAIDKNTKWEKIFENNSQYGFHVYRGGPNGADYSGLHNGHTNQYDSYKVPVLDFEFMDTNSVAYEEKENSHGSYTYKRRDENYRLPKRSKFKRRLDKKYFKTVYKGKWILGTDILFDFGKATYIPRGNRAEKKFYDAAFSFNIYVMGLEEGDMIPVSHVERAIQFIDGLQIAWLKVQNDIAQARPKGLKVNIDVIKRVAAELGLGKGQPIEVLKYFSQTGNLPYKLYVNEDGVFDQNPVSELENGLSKDFPMNLNLMQFNIQMVREVTGVIEGLDASTPDPNQPVGTTELAASGAMDAMKPLMKAYKSIFLRSVKCAAKKLQMVVGQYADRGEKLSGYIQALGESNLRAIELSDDIAYAEFGFSLMDEPQDQDLAFFEQSVQSAVEQRKATGRGGIEVDVAMKARRIAKSGSIKQAERFLAVEMKKSAERDQELERANMQENAQIQQESTMVAHQAKMEESQLELQNELAVIQAKMEADMRLKELEHTHKLREIREEAKFNMNLNRQNNATSLVQEKMRSEASEKRASSVPKQ